MRKLLGVAVAVLAIAAAAPPALAQFEQFSMEQFMTLPLPAAEDASGALPVTRQPAVLRWVGEHDIVDMKISAEKRSDKPKNEDRRKGSATVLYLGVKPQHPLRL